MVLEHRVFCQRNQIKTPEIIRVNVRCTFEASKMINKRAIERSL